MTQEVEYELTVVRRVKNPDYKVYGMAHDYRDNPEYLKVTTLSVTVTKQEFDAIRKACLEVMP